MSGLKDDWPDGCCLWPDERSWCLDPRGQSLRKAHPRRATLTEGAQKPSGQGQEEGRKHIQPSFEGVSGKVYTMWICVHAILGHTFVTGHASGTVEGERERMPLLDARRLSLWNTPCSLVFIRARSTSMEDRI